MAARPSHLIPCTHTAATTAGTAVRGSDHPLAAAALGGGRGPLRSLPAVRGARPALGCSSVRRRRLAPTLYLHTHPPPAPLPPPPAAPPPPPPPPAPYHHHHHHQVRRMLRSLGRALPRLLPRARHRPTRVHPLMPRQPAQRHRRAHDAASHAAAQPAAAAAITMARAAEPMSAVMWADDCRAGLCRSCPLGRRAAAQSAAAYSVPYLLRSLYRTLSVYERVTSVPYRLYTLHVYRYLQHYFAPRPRPCARRATRDARSRAPRPPPPGRGPVDRAIVDRAFLAWRVGACARTQCSERVLPTHIFALRY